MSNVLSDEKKQQVIALGKLGWSLRRIEEATGVRRETASSYLKAAGVVVCLPGWGRRAPSKPAIGETTDPEKQAIQVTTDFYAAFSQNSGPPKRPSRRPARANPIASRSSWDSVLAGMPWQFGKTWCRTTVLLVAMRR